MGREAKSRKRSLFFHQKRLYLFFSKVKIFAHRICANPVHKHEEEGGKDTHSASPGPGLQDECVCSRKAWAQVRH